MAKIHFEGILRGQCGRYEKLPATTDDTDGNKGARRGRPRRRWLKKMSGGIRLSRSIKLRLLSLKTFSIAKVNSLVWLSPIAMNVIFSGHGWGLPALSHPSLQQRPTRRL
ncbi:hypothetical protein HRI_001610300 [Hibiscus trionum]|uniref:Uncharacterized protein n=1 Tax=Hibiscus trionum TaxID=183268 RepID=A0A9W7HKF5_HIBTR|nr:hypothetical protein HRI_001610300 [Hibiscus trionum]